MSDRFQVEWHDSLTSTNDRAIELSKSGAERVAVAARSQTAGRGRRGNAWSSPAGAGLYVSFVARPGVPAARSPLLTLMCGMAVHDAFAPRVEGRLGLKWPNDVLATGPDTMTGRKVAGILVESSLGGDRLEHAVFGIGVNLAPVTHDDPDAARRAVSLAELGAEGLDAETAYDLLEGAFASLLDRAEADLDFIPEAWEARAIGLGHTIAVQLPEERITGRFLGIDRDGALRLADAGGVRLLHTGEVDPATLF